MVYNICIYSIVCLVYTVMTVLRCVALYCQDTFFDIPPMRVSYVDMINCTNIVRKSEAWWYK